MITIIDDVLCPGSIWDVSQWEESLIGLVRGLIGAGGSELVGGLAQALVRQGQQSLGPRERHAQLTSLACIAAGTGDSKLAAIVIQDALDAARLFQECEQVRESFVLHEEYIN